MPVHTSQAAMDAVHEYTYKLIFLQLVLPDLASSDCQPFLKLKNTIGAKDLRMLSWLVQWRAGLGDQDHEIYRSGIIDWQTR